MDFDSEDEEGWMEFAAQEEARMEEEEAAAARTTELSTNRKRARDSTAEQVIYPLCFQFCISVLKSNIIM